MGVMEFPKKVMTAAKESDNLFYKLYLHCGLAVLTLPILVMLVVWVCSNFLIGFRWAFFCFSVLSVLYKLFLELSKNKFGVSLLWLIGLGLLNYIGFLVGPWMSLLTGLVGFGVFVNLIAEDI